MGGRFRSLPDAHLILEDSDRRIGIAAVEVAGSLSPGDERPFLQVVVAEGDALPDGNLRAWSLWLLLAGPQRLGVEVRLPDGLAEEKMHRRLSHLDGTPRPSSRQLGRSLPLDRFCRDWMGNHAEGRRTQHLADRR